MRHYGLLLATIALAGCGATNQLQPLGLGSYAAPPQTVTMQIKNYQPQPGSNLQHLFVSNYSVRPIDGVLYWSQARDGMTDQLKTQLAGAYGFTVDEPESVVTGFADALLFKLGIQIPSQSVIRCAPTQMESSTGDGFEYNDQRLAGSPLEYLGLRDCEKTYLNLNPNKFDNAGNGIPDSLKLRCGLNPLNAADAFVSTAGDNVANIDKCKQNIPIDELASTQPNQLFAYHYETRDNGDGTFDLTISNIPVLHGGDQNFIAFMIVEQNPNTNVSQLFTAFTLTRPALIGVTSIVDYWATNNPSTFTNQQITIP